MTPCESFLFSKNASSILKQLVLIAFFTQKYMYIYISNFVYRNRTEFYFCKSYLNDAFCENVNQLILICWTHLEEGFLQC